MRGGLQNGDSSENTTPPNLMHCHMLSILTLFFFQNENQPNNNNKKKNNWFRLGSDIDIDNWSQIFNSTTNFVDLVQGVDKNNLLGGKVKNLLPKNWGN